VKILKILLVLVLIGLNAIALIMTSNGFPARSLLVSGIFGYAILGPAIIGLLYLIPRKNRTFGHFLNAFTLVSVLLFASAVPRMVDDANKPPQTITSKDGSVQLVIPGLWRASPQANPNVVISMVDQMGVVSAIVGLDDIGPVPPQQYAGALANKFAGTEKFQSMSGPFSCTPKDLCAYYEVKMAFGEKGTTSIIAAIAGKRHFIQFMGSTNTNLYDSHKDELLSILASVHEPVGSR
jgi:hypothetical protein